MSSTVPKTNKPTQERTYEPVTLGQDVLGLADVVLEDLALVPADLTRPGLAGRLVTQREGVETERRDAVLLTTLRQMAGRTDHSKGRCEHRERERDIADSSQPCLS